MKNTLKKVLCTALAAVSLSAMVTVPSSLNKPESEKCCIHVLEAEAKEKILYEAYVLPGKHYYTRRNPYKQGKTTNDKPNNIIPENELITKDKEGHITNYNLDQYQGGTQECLYKKVQVYEELGNWARISPSDEKYNGKKRERWVYLPRLYKCRPSEYAICNAGRHPKDDKTVKHCCTYYNDNQKREIVICTICGNTWTRPQK